MQGISIVKLTSRHSTAYVYRGRRLIEARLLFEEILYPICDSIFEISATQLRFLTEIAFMRFIRYTVNIAIKKGKSFPQGERKLSIIMRCPF